MGDRVTYYITPKQKGRSSDWQRARPVSLYDAQNSYHSIPLEKGVTVQVEDKLLFHRQMLDKYTNQQMHDLTAYLVTLK